MRTAFIQQLITEARRNPRLFLVVGDLGYSVVEPFAEEFPDRFLNAGVAEQNMTGMAAGLASEGYHVFTYSIANFSTLRCLEQIRNDVCYHRLPVTVVAVGGGLAYGNLGYSHHAIQDFAILRTMPNITVLAPADPGETRECVRFLSENPRPSYLRVGKAGEPQLHDNAGLEKGPLLAKSGSGPLAIVSTGGILGSCLQAAEALRAEGLEIPVYSLPWLHPIHTDFLSVLNHYKMIVSVEEHVMTGGLAALLRDHLLSGVVVLPMAVHADTYDLVGTQSYLRAKSGLDAGSIAATVARAVQNRA